MIKISINNTRHEVSNDSNILDVLEQLGYSNQSMLGIALNKTFVPKTEWHTTQLKNNDQVDILKPISGG